MISDQSQPAAHSDFLDVQKTLERRAEELSILNHLAEAISSSLELDDILHSICREMVRVFAARNVGIALLNDTRDRLKVVAFHTEQPDESDVTGLEIDLEGNDASLFVIQTGEPIVVPDAQTNPITRSIHEVMRQRGTWCLMVVPLLARGTVIGTIGIPSTSKAIFARDDVRLAQTIAGQVASVIENAQLHQSVKRARDAAEKELEIGRQIQTFFFPEKIPEINGWSISAYFRSARQVAGDFYDVFTLDDERKVGLVLADVCDKGVGAALFMVLFRSMLRANMIEEFSRSRGSTKDPGQKLVSAVERTNQYIADNHKRANMFATVFTAVMGKDDDNLWYLNCGHDRPVLQRETGECRRLAEANVAIGVFADIRLTCGHITMHRGDTVIAFTDGVIDACAPDGDPFGEEKVLQVLTSCKGLEQRLADLKTAVGSDIAGAEQYDDITWVGFEKG